MPHVSRFKKRESDRSGFDHFELELIKDGPLKVAAEEFDTPRPSRRSLGGEGDIAGSPRSTDTSITSLQTPAAHDNPLFVITAAGGISPTRAHPWMRISGSNNAVTLTGNPQIASGEQDQVLTLQCVDSGVTISQASGVALMASQTLVMTSGDVATFIYLTDGTVWWETSRSRRF